MKISESLLNFDEFSATKLLQLQLIIMLADENKNWKLLSQLATICAINCANIAKLF